MGAPIYRTVRHLHKTRGQCVTFSPKCFLEFGGFRAPEPRPILDPSNFVPKIGFPVAKGFNQGRRNVVSLLVLHLPFFRFALKTLDLS